MITVKPAVLGSDIPSSKKVITTTAPTSNITVYVKNNAKVFPIIKRNLKNPITYPFGFLVFTFFRTFNTS